MSQSLVAVLVLSSSLYAQSAGLGRIEFPTSGPAKAQEHFLRGVLLLHSFEYDDAREEFQAARKIAPGFAMAAWGEAMTYNEPVWFSQKRDAARAALQRLALTPEQRRAKAPTEREKDYLGAVETLYGEGTKEDRDFAYAEAMRRLHEKYPKDLEAAAFYALSLLGTCHHGRDFRVYMQAAAVVEEIAAKNPEHPGALHYLIHCYDDPIHASLGLRAARVYAKVAGEAAHALHMPSHIFVAMGMWDEVVASNEDSWAASEARVKRKRLPLDHRGYHSLWWLEYGYLQQGRFQDARRLLEIIEHDAKASPSPRIRFHLAQMLAAYRIDTGEPYAISGGHDISGLDPAAIAADLLAAGIVSLNRGWHAEAERSAEGLRHLAGRAEAVFIAEKELSALMLMADGKSKEALELMTKAAEMEDGMSFEFGPPVPAKPAHELYGEILLQLARPQEARQQFELALKRAPKRVLSLLGLARSFTQMGDKAAARQTYAELDRIWRRADPEVRKALEESLRTLAAIPIGSASPGARN